MSFRTQLRRLGEELGDLVDRHEKAADLADFQEYRDDPVRFASEVLGSDLWSAQVEIAEAVRDHDRVVVRGSNAIGKDFVAAATGLWWTFARRGLVLLTGPTQRQTTEVAMGEIAKAWSRASDLPGELYQSALRLGREEDAGILAFTSTSASRLTGFHAENVLAIITEAQGVESFAWEGLLACATGADDRLLAVGNPLTPSGKFFSVSRSENWHAIQVSAEEHPNLDPDSDRHIPGGPSREFVERIAEEYGQGSGVYRARVEGEFPDTGDEGLFRRSWLEEAADRWEAGEFYREAQEEGPIAACDPARFGPDSTVLVVRRGPRLETIEAWGRAGTMETVEKLREHLESSGIGRRRWDEWEEKWKPGEGDVVVDTVGVGGGVHDRLDELRYNVSAFNGGKSPKDRKRFLNVRAESYWELRERLEEGRIALPRDEKLFDELVAIRWKPTVQGKIQIEAKDDLKGRLGRSPDRADAVTMAYYSRSVRGRGIRHLKPLKVG